MESKIILEQSTKSGMWGSQFMEARMSKSIIFRQGITMASDIQEALAEIRLVHEIDLRNVTVSIDADATEIDKMALEEETLTDGSVVHNLWFL
jgi:hypothetical protein